MLPGTSTVVSAIRDAGMLTSVESRAQLILPGIDPSAYLERAPAPTGFHPRSLAPTELEDGGCFDYASSPGLFLGRIGFGPLRMAWDTNILIDWSQFGARLLRDDVPGPPEVDLNHGDDLAALAFLMNGPMLTRDVRLVALSAQLRDFRHRAPSDRIEWRTMQLSEIRAAWQCLAFDEPPLAKKHAALAGWQAPWISQRLDRKLVEEAIICGCHVFLTRDRDILDHANQLSTLGLSVSTPAELSIEFLSSDASNVYGADGMVADNHKWVHWMRIVEGDDAPGHS
jgi:hypothetical protein